MAFRLLSKAVQLLPRSKQRPVLWLLVGLLAGSGLAAILISGKVLNFFSNNNITINLSHEAANTAPFPFCMRFSPNLTDVNCHYDPESKKERDIAESTVPKTQEEQSPSQAPSVRAQSITPRALPKNDRTNKNSQIADGNSDRCPGSSMVRICAPQNSGSYETPRWAPHIQQGFSDIPWLNDFGKFKILPNGLRYSW